MRRCLLLKLSIYVIKSNKTFFYIIEEVRYTMTRINKFNNIFIWTWILLIKASFVWIIIKKS